MDKFIFEIILLVIGAIIVHFTSSTSKAFNEIKNDVKDMSTSMNGMNTKLEVLIASHSNTEELAKINSKEISKIKDRLHTLEGRESQLLSFLEDYKD